MTGRSIKSLKSLKIGYKEDFNLKKEDITASEIVRGLALNSTTRTFFYYKLRIVKISKKKKKHTPYYGK
ncbi:hypothetical protein D3C85_83330 [compost metagenome]